MTTQDAVLCLTGAAFWLGSIAIVILLAIRHIRQPPASTAAVNDIIANAIIGLGENEALCPGLTDEQRDVVLDWAAARLWAIARTSNSPQSTRRKLQSELATIQLVAQSVTRFASLNDQTEAIKATLQLASDILERGHDG